MKRIQRKREKGWRLPANAKCVDRTTKWGNPFRVVQLPNKRWSVKVSNGDDNRQVDMLLRYCVPDYDRKIEAIEASIQCYKRYKFPFQHGATMEEYHITESNKEAVRNELLGYDLACFCPEGQACHADVLIEMGVSITNNKN